MSDPERPDRAWFAGCGTCNGKAWVIAGAVVRDRDCDRCERAGTDPNDIPYVLDHLVTTELGWCGCGNPEEVDRMMVAYLTARSHDDFPKPRAEGVSEDAERLLAYIADDLGWTEHGGGVGGAWLTETGKVALHNLRQGALIAADHARAMGWA